MDTARIAWHEVLGICGFWDGSFDNGKMRVWHCPHGLLGPARMVLLNKSAVLYQGIAPLMLKWVVAGCLLTIYNNGW